MSEDRWHGLNDHEWLMLWDQTHWREELLETLVAIAQDVRAAPDDRVGALQGLNEALQIGLVVDLTGAINYPELSRDVLLSITRGCKRGSKKYQQRMSDRMIGARCMIRTAREFIKALRHERDLPNVSDMAS